MVNRDAEMEMEVEIGGDGDGGRDGDGDGDGEGCSNTYTHILRNHHLVWFGLVWFVLAEPLIDKDVGAARPSLCFS